MKNFLLLSVLIFTAILQAGVFDAGGYLFYGDAQARSVWAFAANHCAKQNMTVAPYDVVAGLKDTLEFQQGIQGLGYHTAPFWTDRRGFGQGVALWKNPIAFPYVLESVISVLCITGSAPVPPPQPIPFPQPVVDRCFRYTQHGVTACLQTPGCEWSSDSRKCYSKTGFECPSYTQHGVTACLNNTTASNFRCEWSSDVRECFQKTGYPCEFYTRYGVTACLQSSSRCEWSSDSRSCYTK